MFQPPPASILAIITDAHWLSPEKNSSQGKMSDRPRACDFMQSSQVLKIAKSEIMPSSQQLGKGFSMEDYSSSNLNSDAKRMTASDWLKFSTVTKECGSCFVILYLSMFKITYKDTMQFTFSSKISQKKRKLVKVWDMNDLAWKRDIMVKCARLEKSTS